MYQIMIRFQIMIIMLKDKNEVLEDVCRDNVKYVLLLLYILVLSYVKYDALKLRFFPMFTRTKNVIISASECMYMLILNP